MNICGWYFKLRNPFVVGRPTPRVWGCADRCHTRLYRFDQLHEGRCPRDCGATAYRGSLLAERWQDLQYPVPRP